MALSSEKRAGMMEELRDALKGRRLRKEDGSFVCDDSHWNEALVDIEVCLHERFAVSHGGTFEAYIDAGRRLIDRLTKGNPESCPVVKELHAAIEAMGTSGDDPMGIFVKVYAASVAPGRALKPEAPKDARARRFYRWLDQMGVVVAPAPAEPAPAESESKKRPAPTRDTSDNEPEKIHRTDTSFVMTSGTHTMVVTKDMKARCWLLVVHESGQAVLNQKWLLCRDVNSYLLSVEWIRAGLPPPLLSLTHMDNRGP